MKEHTVMEIEPVQHRRVRRPRLEKPERANLNEIAGYEMLVLASAIGSSVVRSFELRERKRFVRIFLLIVSGLVTAIGVINLTIQLFKS